MRHLQEARKLLNGDEKNIWQWDFATAFDLAQAFIQCCAFFVCLQLTLSEILPHIDTLTAQYHDAVELAKSVKHECKSDIQRVSANDSVLAGIDNEAYMNSSPSRTGTRGHLSTTMLKQL